MRAIGRVDILANKSFASVKIFKMKNLPHYGVDFLSKSVLPLWLAFVILSPVRLL